MKTIIKNSLITMALIFIFKSNAQSIQRLMNETNVIFVINKKNFEVNDIINYSNPEKLAKILGRIFKRYPKSVFYHGVIKGRYSIEGYSIKPVLGTSMNLYKDKPYFPGDNFFPGDQFAQGNIFKINSIETKVVSNSKTEIIFKSGKSESIKPSVNKKLKRF